LAGQESGEHYLDMVGVSGSSPLVPTNFRRLASAKGGPASGWQLFKSQFFLAKIASLALKAGTRGSQRRSNLWA